MDKISVKIIEQNECRGGYSNSNIKLELNNITFHYANMLRRVLKTYIPTYAYSKVTIVKNTGILNNDQIRERFMNIPIMYVKNDEKTVLQFLDLYNGKTVDENHLSMYINYKNKTGKLAMVTTDMAKFYLDGTEIKSPYKKPILLLKLNNDEEFECTCQSQLGVNLEEQYESPAIYDPVAGCAYEQVEENKFIFNFETNQQFSEKEALRRAISCLLMRLEFLNNMVKEKVNPDSEKEGILNIPNEDMTLGGILGYLLQMHESVDFAGDHQQNISMRTLQIRYKCKKSITDIFDECIDKLSKSLKSMAKQLKLVLIEH
jgi:DNA-directed RNA polymerase alpha subunit